MYLDSSYVVEGPKVQNSTTLLISDTGRVLMKSGTVTEVVHIVSDQGRASTCVANACAKLAKMIFQENGRLVDFNQVVGSFLALMTKKQMKRGLSARCFHQKKINVRKVEDKGSAENWQILLDISEVELMTGKADNSMMMVIVMTGEWLRQQDGEEADRCGARDELHAMAVTAFKEYGNMMASNSWGERFQVLSP